MDTAYEVGGLIWPFLSIYDGHSEVHYKRYNILVYSHKTSIPFALNLAVSLMRPLTETRITNVRQLWGRSHHTYSRSESGH